MVRLASGLGVSVSVLLGGDGSVGLVTVAGWTRLPVMAGAVGTTSLNTAKPEQAVNVPRLAVMVPLMLLPMGSARPFGGVTVAVLSSVPVAKGSMVATIL